MYASPISRRLRVRSLPSRTPHRKAIGVGADTGLLSDPAISDAWSQIEGQMQTEGATSTAVALAQNNFLDTLTGLTGPGGVLSQSADAAKAVDAAKNLIVSGKTILGAVNHVEGLIAVAQGGNSQATFQAFTGTMIGLATTAGVLTAGVGAAVAFGLTVAMDFFQNIGLFGAAPSGVSLPGCSPNVTFNPAPTLAVGCVALTDAHDDPNAGAIQHGSPYWRTFPKGSGGNTNDARWYEAPAPNYIQWAGSPNGPMYTWAPAGFGPRLIDVAFPDWHLIACTSAIPAGLEAFTTAFNQAWVSNKEYEFNGLKSQKDSVVFDHMVQIWNRAHDGSTYVDLHNAPKASVGIPTYTALGKLQWPCPANVPPLYQTLVGALLAQPSPDTPIGPDGNSIRIHTGARIVPKKHLALQLGPPANASPATQIGASWNAMPIGGKAALVGGGAIVAVAAGGSLYAFLTNQGIGYFWGKVFDGVIEGAKNLVGAK